MKSLAAGGAEHGSQTRQSHPIQLFPKSSSKAILL